MQRLDKILSNLGFGSRKEIKDVVKKGRVTVDGVAVRDPAMKVDPEKSRIVIGGEEVAYRRFVYLLLNKPMDVVSATTDNRDRTVIDLLSPEYQVFQPFPVGRLDKDTVGLLLLTNDGELNHRLLHPKHHVEKVYHAALAAPMTPADAEAFQEGIVLEDGYRCLPAGLRPLSSDGLLAEVTLKEGKFHQVKRMFHARGNQVTHLRRVAFGPLVLEDALSEGTFRELTEEERQALLSLKI